jgi:YVTN family beta-propeller protein
MNQPIVHQSPAVGKPRRTSLLLNALGVLAALAVVAPGSAVAAGTSGWTAYVAEAALAGTVTPFNTATAVRGTTIPAAGPEPDALAVSPNGQTAYVADYYGYVTPIELSTGRSLAPIEVGTYPRAIAIAPNGQTAYVVNEGSDSVTPIDLATGEAGKEIDVGKSPNSIAIAPNGQTAYVTDYNAEDVTPVELASGTAGTPIHVGVEPIAIAVTPNGQTAYVANQGGGSGSNGNAVPIDLATGHAGTAIHIGTDYPEGLAIAPNGQTAYVTDYAGAVTPIDIAENKAETPISVGEELQEIAITPDGQTAYATSYNGTKVFSIDLQTGSLGLSITGSAMHGLAITPDQAPVAAFSATAAAPGSPSSFDASASSSAVGSIATYEWNFGDGHSEVTTTPTTAHVYSTPGLYTASLTVADSAGTSLTQVFTGQTMSLDGGPQATATHTVTVSPVTSTGPPAPLVSPVLTLSGLTQSHTAWRERSAHAKGKSTPPVGTKFSFTLNEQASVSLEFTRAVSGRKVGGRCRTKTSSNSHRPSCTRVLVAGKLLVSGHAGVNHVSFLGLISPSKKLPPGRYTLLVRASLAGVTSRPLQVSFKIT